MPDLNLDVNYRDHIKTRRLVGMLGKDAEFAPVKLWLHAGKIHPESGKLKGYSGIEVEALADWSGTPGAFIEAMEKLDWLKKDASGNYVLCGWKEHQGHLIAYKVRGKIAAKARWDKAKQRMPQAYHKHASGMLKHAPSNAPTDCTNGTNLTNVCTLVAAEEPPPASEKNLSQDDWLKSLTANPTYDGLDVTQQFGKMVQWCKTNGKQPTRRRFVNWLNRSDRPMKVGASETDHSKGF